MLIDSQFFNINHKNISQVSVLQLAAYYKKRLIIDWLIANPDFDFNAKNRLGFTEIEQLRLSGKGELADTIERERPEVYSQKFKVSERNTDQVTSDYPNGTPIIDFIRIETGSFMMGDGETKVLTTISKPFEIMSVDITQETYKIVVKQLKQNFRNDEYSILNATPSYFKGQSHPVEQVSYNDISLWIKGLNNLSMLDNTEVQHILEKLFPGHRLGKEYSRPTEAQWELVSRLGGVAESNYSHGKDESDLSEYAFYSQNSNAQTHAVGLKKPVFYFGKPIYDIHGNVSIWLEDWHEQNISGGIDPQGPIIGVGHVINGGRWNFNSALFLRLGNRSSFGPTGRGNGVGFRLIRIIP
jgi:formylglycine-generating enzyme required for sulfatase activity